MSAEIQNNVRTMQIKNHSHDVTSFSEADYDTAVEYSICDVTETNSIFSFSLGAFDVTLDINVDHYFVRNYYILPEDNNRSISNESNPSEHRESRYLSAHIVTSITDVYFYIPTQRDMVEVIEEIYAGWAAKGKKKGDMFEVNPNKLTRLFDAIFAEYRYAVVRPTCTDECDE